MKKLCLVLLLICLSVFIVYNYTYKPTIPENKIKEAIQFCNNNYLSTSYVVFVDFSEHCGKKRFSIYDTKKSKIIYASICANGSNKKQFSNIIGSNLSSLGKYKMLTTIGKMKIGEPCIQLEGLDCTNNNAYKRQILIHSYKSVYYNQGTFPFNFFTKNLSHGCFVIDKKAFKILSKINNKPILLWAYI